MALLRVELSFEGDQSFDAVDLSLAGLAFGAIRGVDLVVLQLDADALERDALEIGVRPEGHRSAGAERRAGEERRYGAWADDPRHAWVKTP